MSSTVMAGAIPRETASGLCEEIRHENGGKWYRWQSWMCWGCSTFTSGKLDERCVASRPDFRGCVQVNARYDAQP